MDHREFCDSKHMQEFELNLKKASSLTCVSITLLVSQSEGGKIIDQVQFTPHCNI